MSILDSSILEKFFGKPQFFKQKFIQSQLDARRGLQRELYERSLNGFEYLAQLRGEGLDPIFKGGSAVQVLLPETIQRLSIDIDLAVDETKPEILKILERINKKFDNKFYNFEESSREHPDFFQIYFIDVPSFFTDTHSKLELDFLFHKPNYQIQEIQLKSFLYESDIDVKIPTIDSLIGDKLTVLAPETIGKPLNRPLQYSKQLYDLSTLLERSTDFQAIYEAYLDVFEFEKKTRGLDKTTPIETLEDLVNICKLYSLTVYRPNWIINNDVIEKITFLKQGIRSLDPYTSVNLKFTFPKARREASKIAFLGKLLKLRYKNDITRSISMKIFQLDNEGINQLFKNSDYMQRITNKIGIIEKNKRIHIYLREFLKTDPLGLLYWYGYYYPLDFLDEIV